MKKTISALLMSAALVAGVFGATTAYRSAAATGSPTGPVTASAAIAKAHAPQVVRPGTRFRWAPCPDGSQLEGRVCVTDVVRTVVIPAPAAPATTGTRNVVSHQSASQEHEGSGGEHEGYDDSGDSGGDDHGDHDNGDGGGGGGNDGGDDD